MRGSLGRAVLRIAKKSLESKGLLSEMLIGFFEKAENHVFESPILNTRYMALTVDNAIAEKILCRQVEQAILDWPDGMITVQLSGSKIQLFCNILNLDADTLARMVNLGVLCTRQLVPNGSVDS